MIIRQSSVTKFNELYSTCSNSFNTIYTYCATRYLYNTYYIATCAKQNDDEKNQSNQNSEEKTIWDIGGCIEVDEMELQNGTPGVIKYQYVQHHVTWNFH